MDQKSFKNRSTNDQTSIKNPSTIDPTSIKNPSKIDHKSIKHRSKSDLGAFWLPRAIPDRFCLDLGRVLWPKRPQLDPYLRPNMEPKSMNIREKTESKMKQILRASWNRKFVRFWWIFEGKMRPSWHSKSTQDEDSRNTTKSKNTLAR